MSSTWRKQEFNRSDTKANPRAVRESEVPSSWPLYSVLIGSRMLFSGDPKNVHLKQLDEARENLHLFKADVLDCETLTRAFEGCEGVFHLATPVPEDKIVDPEAGVFLKLRLRCLNISSCATAAT